ncbi:proline-specific permease [Histoplasma capsulatum]|uniref:Proline-specific permease n=1 Tax=Ajellomyces capsulatus TaxID=5037 RepID=A0A8A1MDA9_AJECA|nr:proline-specific permease [Histoplasma capsulatum]
MPPTKRDLVWLKAKDLYMISIGAVTLPYPSNIPELTSGSAAAGASPFVVGIKHAGIKVLDYIVDTVIFRLFLLDFVPAFVSSVPHVTESEGSTATTWDYCVTLNYQKLLAQYYSRRQLLCPSSSSRAPRRNVYIRGIFQSEDSLSGKA